MVFISNRHTRKHNAITAVIILVSSVATFGNTSPKPVPEVQLPKAGGKFYERVAILNNTFDTATVAFNIHRLFCCFKPDIMESNGENFLIVPGVAKIPPGRKQVFHIEWLRPTQTRQTIRYLIDFNIDFHDGFTGRLTGKRSLKLAVGIVPRNSGTSKPAPTLQIETAIFNIL